MSIDSVSAESATIAGKGTVSPAALVAGLTAVLPHAAAKSGHILALTAIKFSAPSGSKVLTVVATDRYTLGTYRLDWDGGEVDALLNADDAKALLAFAKKAAKLYRIGLTFTDTRLEAFDFDRRTEFRLNTDSPFPAWERLIPDAVAGTDRIDRIGFTPAYMARFAKAGERNTPMVLTMPASAVMAVRVDVGPDFTGLIMTVRIPEGY